MVHHSVDRYLGYFCLELKELQQKSCVSISLGIYIHTFPGTVIDAGQKKQTRLAFMKLIYCR